jgi:hypothetical protein
MGVRIGILNVCKLCGITGGVHVRRTGQWLLSPWRHGRIFALEAPEQSGPFCDRIAGGVQQ